GPGNGTSVRAARHCTDVAGEGNDVACPYRARPGYLGPLGPTRGRQVTPARPWADGRESCKATSAIEHILVVCTANRCRSPLAAALLRDEISRRGVAARVDSSGLLEAGHPATEETLDAASALGLDLEDHRSGQLDIDLARAA